MSRRLVIGGLVILSLAVLILGALAAVDLLTIRSISTDARTNLSESISFLSRSEFEEAHQRLTQARDHIDQAQDHTDGFVMTVARNVPFLGREIRVMDTSLSSAAEVASALQQTTEYMLSPHVPAFRGSEIDSASARNLAAVAQEAEDLMRSAFERISSAPTARVESVAVMAADLTERSRQGVAVTAALRQSAQAVAEAAEGGEPFQVLFVVTDGASLRAVGGVPLALVEGRIDGDGIGVTAVTDPAAADITVPQAVLDVIGQAPVDASWPWLTAFADGPTVARIASEAVTAMSGNEPDVVFIVDLIAAGHLLDGFADLRLDGRGFDPRTLGTDLALEANRNHPDHDSRHQYMAGILGHLLDQAVERGPRSRDLFRGIRRILEQDRIVAWSPHPELQAAFEAEGVDMGPGDDPGRVEVAVANTAGTRLDFFTTLASDLEVEPEECRVRGRLLVSIDESAPESLASSLASGAAANAWRVSVYLPPGAEVVGNTGESEPIPRWNDRPVVALDLTADFGGDAGAEVEWVGPAPADGIIASRLPATVSEGAQVVEVEVAPIEGCD